MANSSRGRAKKIAKTTLKGVLPVSDLVFSNNKVKKVGVKAARVFLNRYAKHGDDIKTTSKRNYSGPWQFMLDTPKIAKSSKRTTYVSGWFVLLKEGAPALRLCYPSGKTVKVTYGIARSDVAEILRTKYRQDVPDKCGFGSTISIDEDGAYYLEAKVGSGWQKVCRFELEYDLDLLAKDVYNPTLSHNYAEHLTLIDTKKRYFSESKLSATYVRDENDPKLIAFYLPQFHPFKENNEWWGEGFTEWTNVSSATPRYVGHEQPKLPADLGFYDLRYEENIYKQIELAKNHGLFGFCFYYYWFSGKQLMEKPLQSILKHKEWDFNFMICWANENWTRRWDGREEDVLIKQEHRPEDPLNFIKDVEHILLDERYIRVEGKPALMVYRAHDLGEDDSYAKIWQQYFQKKHGLELHLIAVQSFSNSNPKEYGFDKALEFAPLSLTSMLKEPIPSYSISEKMLDLRYTGIAYDYRKIALHLSYENKDARYMSVMPSWDNDARKKGSGGVFHNANPDLYGYWLDRMLSKNAREKGSLVNNMLFINAWNEWAEGAYLEPDSMYGHAYLNRTAQVLAKGSSPSNQGAFPMYGLQRGQNKKLAVVIHLFYADMWPLFAKSLEVLSATDYDLFVTIPAKNEDIRNVVLSFKPEAQVLVVPNRGRDVLPFVHLARRLKEVGYEYVLKLHSKRSLHRHDGNLWMQDMLQKLVPTRKEDVDGLIKVLEHENTGLVGPEGHYVSLASYFGSNKENIINILDEVLGQKTTDSIVKNINEQGFFAGTMFWARLDAIGPILDQFYQPSDFEAEKGQIDGTFAHAVERALCLVPTALGKKLYSLDSGRLQEVSAVKAENFEDYSFAKNE